eukprot:164946-Pyramimonas_sp.AAC.1
MATMMAALMMLMLGGGRGGGGEERRIMRGDVSSKRGPNTTGWSGEKFAGRADMRGGTACERSHWGLLRSPQWSHKTFEGAPKLGRNR